MFQGRGVHFTSLGCARNLVDTEVMLGLCIKAGYEVVSEIDEADYIVINTCGFLESARNEAYEILESVFVDKQKKAKVVIAGCMVRLHKNDLKKRFPDIHYFLGAGDVESVLKALSSEEKGEVVTDAKSYLQQGEIPRTLSTPKHYAYLKIAEGCRKRCSFCIIPNIKGQLQSKTIPQVIREVRSLVSGGVKEIILIAQDLGDFGKDRMEKGALVSLLKEIVKVEGEFRVRLLYLYPDEIDDDMIDLLSKEKKIMPYLDMPIQHIDDVVLKRMHRKTDGAQIRSILQKLREKVPDVVVRTSLMVGFPGETEKQFEKLVSFVKEAKLDNIGIFKYSKEEESHSATLDGHIEEEEKERRLERLASVQREVVEKEQKKYINKTLQVLVEGHHPESEALLRGRFYGQCPEIDGEVIITDWRRVDELGEYYDVKITDVAGYDLIGRVVQRSYEKALKPKRSMLNVL